MQGIYEPTGKAREFGDLACNLYTGCNHGCWYCYARSMPWVDKDIFARPELKKGILEQLEKDAAKYAGSRIPIFLCFTCDPYQSGAINNHTRTAMQILQEYDCAINILTKGGIGACRDFDILAMNKNSWFGTTLTYSKAELSKKHEPLAAVPNNRIEAIKIAKAQGLNTWVSMEPIVGYQSAMSLIYKTMDYVDLYKIGKMNHTKGISERELRDFLKDAITLLESNNNNYYIKLDTRPYLV